MDQRAYTITLISKFNGVIIYNTTAREKGLLKDELFTNSPIINYNNANQS